MKVSFPLCISDAPARLALKSPSPLEYKDYLLKFTFVGTESSQAAAEDLNLSYSPGLAALFLYSPGQLEGGVVHTRYFRLPEYAESLSVEVIPWGKKNEPMLINGVNLQIQAPWSKYNHLTQIGVVANG